MRATQRFAHDGRQNPPRGSWR